MAGQRNGWLNGDLSNHNVFQLVQNAFLQEMSGHAPTQDGSGQSAQSQQQQLPAPALPQQWHDARTDSRINIQPVALGQQSSAGYNQPWYIPPYMGNPYAPPPRGAFMQHQHSASRTYFQDQPQMQQQPQPQVQDLYGYQPFKATSQPKPTLNIAPRPPKRKATDQAQRPVSGSLNPDSLSSMPRYSSRPEMATELPQQPPSFPMPSAPIEPLAPHHLNTGPTVFPSRLEDEQPAPEAPPSKSTVPPTRDLTGFSYMPQNPTNKNFLRDRGDLVQPLNDADAATKTNYDPKTIARDILIASGRHPTEPCLNHHLKRLRDVFNLVDTSSDLGTIRWDIVDVPGMQVHRTKSVKKPSSPATLSAPNRGPDSQEQPPANHNPPVVAPRDSHPQDTPPSRPAPVRVSLPQPAVTLSKPKPRPLMKVQLPLISNSSRQQQSPQKQSPVSQHQSQQSQVKPRGRPRKEQSGKMVGTKTAPRVEVAIPQSASVPYPVYACEWENCVSELHNLELLRKHVLKCHVPYTLTCGWLGCTYSDMMTAAELFEHVKMHHIGPLAWKLGDGPSAHRSVDNDEVSRGPQAQATPESNLPRSEDALIFPASHSSIRAFNRVHGNRSQLDKAHEIFKAVQRLKERIGIGLDPGGCQLATPERNERVSDEEEVYELHPESETESAGTWS